MRATPRLLGAWILAVFCATATGAYAGELFVSSTGGDVGVRGVTIAPIEDLRFAGTSYGSPSCRETLGHAATIGASWVSITPFGRMDDLDDAEVLPDFEVPVEEMERMIEQAAADAHARGLRVAVIPHVYVLSGRWRGQIEFASDKEWEAWFDSYEGYVLRYARLSERIGAEMLSIGVEFGSSTNYRPERWRELIARVRKVYSGSLTYSANWDEVEWVEFWDLLDGIGVNAFWPWATKPGDGWEQITSRAEDIADELEALALRWNRPVLFTEFGVKSAMDSAVAPWEWPEHLNGLKYDEEYQAVVYSAVLEELVAREWFWGLFIWKYFSDSSDDTQEDRCGFSPREKRAEETLSQLYRRTWAVDRH